MCSLSIDGFPDKVLYFGQIRCVHSDVLTGQKKQKTKKKHFHIIIWKMSGRHYYIRISWHRLTTSLLEHLHRFGALNYLINPILLVSGNSLPSFSVPSISPSTRLYHLHTFAYPLLSLTSYRAVRICFHCRAPTEHSFLHHTTPCRWFPPRLFISYSPSFLQPVFFRLPFIPILPPSLFFSRHICISQVCWFIQSLCSSFSVCPLFSHHV